MSEEATSRQSPVHNKLREFDAKFIDECDWETPEYYEMNDERTSNFELPTHLDEPDAIGAEILANRESVGLHEISVLAPLEISGPSAPEFIQRVFTNDMDIEVGQIRYTVMLDDEGKNMGDITVNRLADDRYFATTLAGETATEHTEWLRSVSPADVTITNLDDAYTCLGLWGPEAHNVIQPLTDADMSRDAFPFFTSRQIEVAGVPVIANRISYVGEFGWELWTVPGHEAQLWDSLWESGQDFDILPVGLEALLTMGVEKGYRLPGADMGPENTPFEAGLGFTVDMDTDFIGKESLERALDEGTDQQITCITLDDDEVLPDVGAPVYVDGDQVSEVNRNAYAHSVGENVVNAYLPTKYAEPETTVEVGSGDNRYSATVREEPLFDPEDERMRG
ncbi:aminomethyltransferase family protein [Halobium palmae]|uniref:Aminomethyltransferase family protein n=1 Tax=Halobium palmae TaxID=1776492 RepID=A0ABD5RVH8_9EURY